jgi:ABC-type multidrug transport system fused ATPase/permease subunit
LNVSGVWIFAGSLRVDGAAVRSADEESSPPRIVAISQEPLLLMDTNVRQNLRPGMSKPQNAYDEHIADALVRVGLWETLQRGVALGGWSSVLDLSMEAAAQLLSQGQKQLFCLARTILADSSSIVVLDEAMGRLAFAFPHIRPLFFC